MPGVGGVRRAAAQQRRPATGDTITPLGPLWWYDSKDVSSTGQQAIIDRVGATKTVTLGSTSGVDTNDPTITLGARPSLSFTANDYLQHQAGDTPTVAAGSGSMTVVTCLAMSTSAAMWIWSSETANDNAFVSRVAGDNTVRAHWGGTVASVAVPTLYNGTVRVIAAVVAQGAPSTMRAYERTAGFGTAVNVSGTLTHGPPRIGSRAHVVANAATMTWYATCAFPTALSLTELDGVADQLLAGTYT